MSRTDRPRMIDYVPGKVGEFYIVRGLGSGATHVAAWQEWDELLAFRRPFLGSLSSVDTLCGAVIGKGGHGVVVMREGSKLTCARCKRFAAKETK